MRAILLAFLVTTVGLAGCMGGEETLPAETPAANGGNVSIEERPETTFTEIALGPAAAPDLEATLERAPQLKVGEWWKIRLESPIDGTTSEFVRVVADIDGDTYVFGMPHEGWWKEAVVYHTPAFGDVNSADLSYLTHDILFTPLKFPLEEGQTWETEFSGGPTMTASVAVTSPTEATVTFTTQGGGILGPLPTQNAEPQVALELVYDATLHEVREFRHPTVTFTVVEHGYDFQGWVTVPRAEKLVFFHGRIGPALDIGLQPAAPVETVEVSGGFNRVSFIQVTSSLTPVPGAFREHAVAPDGTEYTTEAIPGQGFQIQFFEAKDPDGAWQLEHVVGGAGFAFIEGIAYHQYDIRLPDGAIRSDHSHEVIR